MVHDIISDERLEPYTREYSCRLRYPHSGGPGTAAGGYPSLPGILSGEGWLTGNRCR